MSYNFFFNIEIFKVVTTTTEFLKAVSTVLFSALFAWDKPFHYRCLDFSSVCVYKSMWKDFERQTTVHILPCGGVSKGKIPSAPCPCHLQQVGGWPSSSPTTALRRAGSAPLLGSTMELTLWTEHGWTSPKNMSGRSAPPFCHIVSWARGRCHPLLSPSLPGADGRASPEVKRVREPALFLPLSHSNAWYGINKQSIRS